MKVKPETVIPVVGILATALVAYGAFRTYQSIKNLDIPLDFDFGNDPYLKNLENK